jgi:hypothetical protein
MSKRDKVLYSLSTSDFQEVALETIGRRLTAKEMLLVQETVGNYINWREAIEYAIQKNVSNKRRPTNND